MDIAVDARRGTIAGSSTRRAIFASGSRPIFRRRGLSRLADDKRLRLAPAVTRAVIEEFTRIPARAQPAIPRAVGELTPREREVLDLLIRGLSNPEICRELVISDATAKTHVAKILQKLGLRDRVQAVIYAYETGLVSPGPAP